MEAEEGAEAPVEDEERDEEERSVCARLSAIRVATPAPAAIRRRGPGRPRGSTSKPRVEPRFDRSAPPERAMARKAMAKITARK